MTSGRRGLIRGLAAAALLLAGCDRSAQVTPAPSGPIVPASVGLVVGPWSATPFALDPALIAALDRACRTSSVGQDFPAGVRLVIVDARGGGVVHAYYVGAGMEAQCNGIHVDADGTIEASGGGGWGTAGINIPIARGIRIHSSGSTGTVADATAFVWGAYGPDIARIAVEQRGHEPVVAVMQGGWWAVSTLGDWAPGAQVTGYDALGAQVLQVPVR